MGGGGGRTRNAPPKIGRNMIFWRKIVIFHTKYPNFFKCAPPPNLKSWIRPWKLLTVQVHLYSPVAFSRIRVFQSLVFYLVCCVPLFCLCFLFYCLSFDFENRTKQVFEKIKYSKF